MINHRNCTKDCFLFGSKDGCCDCYLYCCGDNRINFKYNPRSKQDVLIFSPELKQVRHDDSHVPITEVAQYEANIVFTSNEARYNLNTWRLKPRDGDIVVDQFSNVYIVDNDTWVQTLC